jgi:tRNA threonylcarbamoyladenosine biosynthesis protein TsaE
MRKIFEINSREDTILLGEKIGSLAFPNMLITMNGDLGAGKTEFVKGVAKYFTPNAEVTSPTYAYLNIYGDYIYHYDCYRLSSGEDAEMLGLTDYFNGKNVCFIEWAENIEDVLPSNCKKVTIKKIDDDTREIVL